MNIFYGILFSKRQLNKIKQSRNQSISVVLCELLAEKLDRMIISSRIPIQQ